MFVVALPQQTAMMVARRSSQDLVTGARRASRDVVVGARRATQDLSSLMVQGRRFTNPLELYQRFEQARPKLANATVGAVCAFVGDAVAQKMKKDEGTEVAFDWKRSATFTAFNFLWMGGPTRTYLALLGQSGMTMMSKLFTTHAVYNPFIYMPGFYFGVGAMRGESLSEIGSKMTEEAPSTLAKCTVFWLPASAVQYSMVPAAMQIPYMSALSIVWSVILASSG